VNRYWEIQRFIEHWTEALDTLRQMRKPEDPDSRNSLATEIRVARSNVRKGKRMAFLARSAPSRVLSYTKRYIPRHQRLLKRKAQRRARRAS
jgi:hypothetical protein